MKRRYDDHWTFIRYFSCRTWFFYCQMPVKGKTFRGTKIISVLCGVPAFVASCCQRYAAYAECAHPADIGCHHMRVLGPSDHDDTADLTDLHKEFGKSTVALLAAVSPAVVLDSDRIYESYASPLLQEILHLCIRGNVRAAVYHIRDAVLFILHPGHCDHDPVWSKVQDQAGLGTGRAVYRRAYGAFLYEPACYIEDPGSSDLSDAAGIPGDDLLSWDCCVLSEFPEYQTGGLREHGR